MILSKICAGCLDRERLTSFCLLPQGNTFLRRFVSKCSVKALGIVPVVEEPASLIDHGEIRQEIVLVVEILILYGLMEPFHSPILLGTVGIKKVMWDACILYFFVKVQEILTPVVRIDGSNGKRKVDHDSSHEISSGG